MYAVIDWKRKHMISYLNWIEKYHSTTLKNIASNHRNLLTAGRSAVVAFKDTFKALLITRLGVGSRLLGSTTCALIEDVALINGLILVTLWRTLVLNYHQISWMDHTELLVWIGRLAVVVLGRLNGSFVLEDANFALTGAVRMLVLCKQLNLRIAASVKQEGSIDRNLHILKHCWGDIPALVTLLLLGTHIAGEDRCWKLEWWMWVVWYETCWCGR